MMASVAATALLLAAAPAAAATAGNARDVCKARLQSQFSASASNVVTSPRGDDRWEVAGTASRKGERGHFNCSVNGYDITNIETSNWEQKKDDGAAVAVGAIALAAIIAAAASRKSNHENDRYQYNNNWNNNYAYNNGYSPSGGVTCYRNQRACYNSWNNNYNAHWSQREFRY